MNIPEKYKGNLRARIIKNTGTESGKHEYYVQLLMPGQEQKFYRPDKYVKDIKYFNEVNYNFFEKLEETVLKISKGELKISDLENIFL